MTARHYSGRLFTRNQTLWYGYTFITPRHKVFFSGYSGYREHFKAIGERFGGFTLALMDNRQYNKRRYTIHMLPKDVDRATEELKAKCSCPFTAVNSLLLIILGKLPSKK